MRTLFLNEKPTGRNDPVVVVVPTQWMQDIRRKFGNVPMRQFAGLSYAFDTDSIFDSIDWTKYGFDSQEPTIAASSATIEQLMGWIDATAKAIGISKSDLVKTVPMRVLQGWDIGIGDPNTLMLESLLEQTELFGQIGIYVDSDDLIEVLAKGTDDDSSFRLGEVALTRHVDNELPEWMEISGYIPKGWYTITTRSRLSRDPQSINYQVLKI